MAEEDVAYGTEVLSDGPVLLLSAYKVSCAPCRDVAQGADLDGVHFVRKSREAGREMAVGGKGRNIWREASGGYHFNGPPAFH